MNKFHLVATLLASTFVGTCTAVEPNASSALTRALQAGKTVLWNKHSGQLFTSAALLCTSSIATQVAPSSDLLIKGTTVPGTLLLINVAADMINDLFGDAITEFRELCHGNLDPPVQDDDEQLDAPRSSCAAAA